VCSCSVSLLPNAALRQKPSLLSSLLKLSKKHSPKEQKPHAGHALHAWSCFSRTSVPTMCVGDSYNT
jgi:hypothetical protein